jgi:hypothetical protein
VSGLPIPRFSRSSHEIKSGAHREPLNRLFAINARATAAGHRCLTAHDIRKPFSKAACFRRFATVFRSPAFLFASSIGALSLLWLRLGVVTSVNSSDHARLSARPRDAHSLACPRGHFVLCTPRCRRKNPALRLGGKAPVMRLGKDIRNCYEMRDFKFHGIGHKSSGIIILGTAGMVCACKRI